MPELRSLQEYVGSQQPVLMDWAVGLAFPCQQPMLHANGVTEVPKFRITPDYTAKKQDTDTWEDGLNGGLLGISDLLLRAHVMATYLSRDWGRDWGSLRKFDTIVDAQPAEIELGTATRSGLWKPSKIRIGTVGWPTAFGWATRRSPASSSCRSTSSPVSCFRRRPPTRGGSSPPSTRRRSGATTAGGSHCKPGWSKSTG